MAPSHPRVGDPLGSNPSATASSGAPHVDPSPIQRLPSSPARSSIPIYGLAPQSRPSFLLNASHHLQQVRRAASNHRRFRWWSARQARHQETIRRRTDRSAGLAARSLQLVSCGKARFSVRPHSFDLTFSYWNLVVWLVSLLPVKTRLGSTRRRWKQFWFPIGKQYSEIFQVCFHFAHVTSSITETYKSK